MKVIIVKDYDAMSDMAAEIIANKIKEKNNAILGLATGSSPIGTYQRLVKKYENGEISFKNITTYNLDEYCGIDRTHPQSYYYFMHDNLFNHVDIKEENVHLPVANGKDLNACAKEYNDALNKVHIDLQLLGIGNNGHIGFNEPDEVFSFKTHKVELTESTIKANSRLFENIEDVPKFAYTMGVGEIMAAKSVLILASGKAKAPIIKELLTGEVKPSVPASILKFHPNCILIADEEALSEL